MSFNSAAPVPQRVTKSRAPFGLLLVGGRVRKTNDCENESGRETKADEPYRGLRPNHEKDG
jgi:hypothetical protein